MIRRIQFISIITIGIFFGIVLTRCGSGGSADLPPTVVEGILLDNSQQAVANVAVFIFETNESSITDDSGAFSISSYKHLTTGKFYFQTTELNYTNTIDVGPIPDEVVTINMVVNIDKASNQAKITQLNFDTAEIPNETPSPEPTSEPGITPAPGSTVAPGKTPSPSKTAIPGKTSVPDKTPTPKAGKFDSAGNTSAFGIPSGVKGNITKGSSVWGGQCQSCHAAEKTNRVFGQIKASLRVIPTMTNLHLSTQEIADITAYLNRNKR